MSHGICIWARRVHERAMATGRQYTPREAQAEFGPPSGITSSSKLLSAAADAGWFVREDYTEESTAGVAHRCRYKAIEPKAPGSGAKDRRPSYFDGLKRVRSVFDLGGTL